MKCQYCRNEFVADSYGNCSKCGGHKPQKKFNVSDVLDIKGGWDTELNKYTFNPYQFPMIRGHSHVLSEEYSLCPSGSSAVSVKYMAGIPDDVKDNLVTELWDVKKNIDDTKRYAAYHNDQINVLFMELHNLQKKTTVLWRAVSIGYGLLFPLVIWALFLIIR